MARAGGSRGERLRERLRDQKETHKRRPLLYRAGVVAGGVLLVLAGVALSLPGVPGPGILVVALGLFLLALEFDRAERLLERLLVYLDRAGERAARTGRGTRIAGAAAVAAGIAALVAALVLFDVPLIPG